MNYSIFILGVLYKNVPMKTKTTFSIQIVHPTYEGGVKVSVKSPKILIYSFDNNPFFEVSKEVVVARAKSGE